MDHQTDVIPSILNPIREIRRNGGHILLIENSIADRDSLQYLVDFLRGDSHKVTDLYLHNFSLSNPSDGSLSILQGFFANNTTLTCVILSRCNFGNTQQATQVLEAFQTNRTVTDLKIFRIRNLEVAALGRCLSGLLQHNTHLRTLDCSGHPTLDAGISLDAGIRALQPGLRSNQHLKKLLLSNCRIGNEGLRLLLDALYGNTTLEELDVSLNNFTSTGLAANFGLLEFTQLRNVDLWGTIAASDAFMQHLLHTLHRNTTIEGIGEFDILGRFPVVGSIFARNRSLRRSRALLALQPRTRLPIGSKSGLWYMAIAMLGRETSGASAIFDIFQKRPALLERQLTPPQQQTASQGSRRAAVEQERADRDHDDDHDKSSGRKRARRS